MTVELISVGTEILLGNIVNTNAAFLAEECAGLGLSCYYQSVVGDNEERLCAAIETALGRSDILILGGGLGPTQDDLTKECAAKVLGKELQMDPHSKERIEAYFQKRGLTLTENNWKQAMVPEGAIVIDNDNGTAPGLILEKGEQVVLLLPGPPNELKPMFLNKMVPYLRKKQPTVIFSEMVKICGVGESIAETMIRDLIDAQTNPTIATYAKTSEVHIRVTAKADSKKEAKALVEPMVKELKKRFGNHIYTCDENVTLEQALVDMLKKEGLTISTAESCTGGMVASRLIGVPGVSETYKSGLITYSNKAKRRLLGVKSNTLKEFGAVSEQVAKQMAKGVAKLTGADVTIATTGIAGPDGGSEEKPVGLVYVAVYVKGQTMVRKFQFDGNREKIRQVSTAQALIFARKCILGSNI